MQIHNVFVLKISDLHWHQWGESYADNPITLFIELEKY